MISISFEANIIDGDLRHQESLVTWEGRRVRVTLESSGPAATGAPDEADSPVGLDVEKDVYVKIPFKTEVVEGAAVVEGGRLRPCLILPEELPDD